MYKSVVEKQHMHCSRSRHTAQLAGSVYWVDPYAEQSSLSGRTLVSLVCTGIEQLFSVFLFRACAGLLLPLEQEARLADAFQPPRSR